MRYNHLLAQSICLSSTLFKKIIFWHCTADYQRSAKGRASKQAFFLFSGMPSSVDKIFKQPRLLLRSLTMLLREKESLSTE